MAIKLDNGEKSDNAIGIAFMEGAIGRHDMNPIYAKFLKQPTYKSMSDTLLWTPYQDPDARIKTYDGAHRRGHQGAVDYGHTALILRKGGIVTKMIGFVPTKGPDQWPCLGQWVNNLPMLGDPMALSYEVKNNHDAEVMSDTMDWLAAAKDDWKFKYDFPKMSGSSDSNTFNCIGAALTVLIRKATETNDYWVRLMKYCEGGSFSQSKVKAGIMTGDFLV